MAEDPFKADSPSTDSPDERVRALEAELAASRDEVQQNHEKWLRERADLENLKRRTARERDDLRKFANEQVLKDILPVIDNLERAVQHARGGGNGEPLVEGVGMVLKALQDMLQRHGVSRVPARGEPFDPVHHEAMAQVESAAHAPGSVIEEHQAGYRLHDRLLRPALVTVSRSPVRPGNLAKDKTGG